MAFGNKKTKRVIPSDDLIVLEDVVKTYQDGNGALALNGISLTIKRGEFVFIVGDSGSGKSTLIKLLLREIVPTGGEVYVSGQNTRKLRHSQIPKFRQEHWNGLPCPPPGHFPTQGSNPCLLYCRRILYH